MLTSKIIKIEGHQVITARDGEVGDRQFLSAAPDFILVDMQIPKMDGYELRAVFVRMGDNGSRSFS